MVDMNQFYNDLETFMNERFSENWNIQTDHEGKGLLVNLNVHPENFQERENNE